MLAHDARPRSLALLAALAVALVSLAGPAAASPSSGVDSEPVSGDREGRGASDAQTLAATDTEFSAAAAGFISGTIRYQLPGGGDAPAANGGMLFYNSDAPYELEAFATTDGTGFYSIDYLPAGTYFLSAFSYDPIVPVRDWYPTHARFRADATGQTFTEGDDVDLGTYVIDPRNVEVERVSGADRFATAVALSQSQFATASGPPVFIVNGRNFPDALSGGGLAAQAGLLLLVEPNSLPAVVRAELTRLEPSSITIVGGTSVVSSSVESALQAYVSSPDEVTRIAGADRYDTSRRVITSSNGFGGSVSGLIVATGRNFPDALSAVPAAGITNYAILLVDGSASRLDSATRSLVAELDVPVTVVGGTSVVSRGIVTELGEISPLAERVAGADRFETAVAVGLRFFNDADYAYQANAFNFPDALAAGPIAAAQGAPLYLVRKECVPRDVVEEILLVLANKVISVGGSSVLSGDAVRGDVLC